MESTHIHKYYELLDHLRQKRKEKDEYIGFFEFALAKANDELKKRCQLAMSINRKKFAKRFPDEAQSFMES